MDIFSEAIKIVFIILLALSAGVGLLALASPRMLAAVAAYGNRAVIRGGPADAGRRRIDIDSFLLANGRLFGLLVLTTLGYVWMVARYGPEACPQWLMLTVVIVALMMGMVALRHIMWQSRQIQAHLAEAHVDPLTGLANRRAFDKEFDRRLAQRHRQGTPLCLTIIDVDKFKTFNDEFGHPLGDAILKQIAHTLEAVSRGMDIVARLGGDEFAVLMPGTELEAASRGAERLRSAIGDRPLLWDGREHRLTVSIGLAEARADDDPATLVKRADAALYAAKEAGRNCCFRQGVPEPAVAAGDACPAVFPAEGEGPENEVVLVAQASP